MATRKEKEELYEIMPVESYSDIQSRSEQLEKEIEEIKASLKGAVGLARVEAGAQEIITQMLDMVKTSQKLVEQVANSNQKLAEKVQEALDRMNETNEALSKKLGTILDSFVQATTEMEAEPDETGKVLTALQTSFEALINQNSKILQTLTAIEAGLKKVVVRQPIAPSPRKIQRMPRRPFPSKIEEPDFGEEEELPPPPFPE